MGEALLGVGLLLDAAGHDKAEHGSELLVNPAKGAEDLVILVRLGSRSNDGESSDGRAEPDEEVVCDGKCGRHKGFSCKLTEQLLDTYAWLYTGWAYNLGTGLREAAIAATAYERRRVQERLFQALTAEGVAREIWMAVYDGQVARGERPGRG